VVEQSTPLDRTPLELAWPADALIGGGRRVDQGFFQPFHRQALAAVGPLLRARQEFGGKKQAQLLQQREKIQAAQVLTGALALGGQLGAQGGKEGGDIHRAVYIPPY